MSHEVGAFAKRKCPCCKNPWSTDTESDNCKTRCFEGGGTDSVGVSPANFDLSVRPQDDFYAFANGGWINDPKNACPPEYSSWNTFTSLRDRNLERLKDILDELQQKPLGEGESAKVQQFYQAFMNEDKIEEALPSTLESLIKLCLSDDVDPTTKVAALHRDYGIGALFKFYSMPDKNDSNWTIGSLYQGGLAMPDRDYYILADKADKREAYLVYVKTMLELLGEWGVAEFRDKKFCASSAQAIIELETSLAKAHFTRTECRDPQATWNKMTVARASELVKRQPLTWSSYLVRSPLDEQRSKIDLPAYMALIGRGDVVEVNVAQISALKKAAVIPAHPAFKLYLAFLCVDSFAKSLPKAFAAAHFEFHDKTLSGQLEPKPRWKLALALLEGSFGDALGKLYIAKHFSPSAKDRALEIVHAVRAAVRERLREVPWMGEATKAEALKKMDAFSVKIAFPDADAWIDYTPVTLSSSHFDNVVAARRFHFQLDLARVEKETDRKRWLMTPQTVNAYFHPSLNEIVFPAAILQPPFFDASADLAVQFGSMGAVVAHEISHGYDDSGRKYDWQGRLRDWWSAADAAEYEKRKEVMVAQASAFTVYGLKLNGNLTTGENVADLGGVRLAYRAMCAHPTATSAPAINGLTPPQRFFLAWASCWRDNSKEEYKKQMLVVDPHGPQQFRCNGPLSNFDAFHAAWAVEEGDPMYRKKEKRVDIW